MRGLRRAAMASLALALASCWTPPFDAALSISEMTAKKLERVAVIGPVEFSGFMADKSYFVPSYEALPQDGYWVCEEGDSRLVIRYVATVAGKCVFGPGRSFEPNYWKGLNAVRAMSQASAASILSPGMGKAIHVWGTGPVGISASEAMLGIGVETDYSFQAIATATTSGFSQDMLPIGGSAHESVSPGLWQDLLLSGYSAGTYVLMLNSPVPQMHSLPYGTPIINYSVGNILNYTGPELRPGAFFMEYTDPATGTFDLVVGKPKDGGDVVALRWDAGDRSSPPVRVPLKQRITDVLHDNTLVARGATETEFFDVGGKPLYSLPTGALRFIHELYDGTTWYSYFTRTVIMGGSGDVSKGDIRFDVFRCPTSDLAGLAD